MSIKSFEILIVIFVVSLLSTLFSHSANVVICSQLIALGAVALLMADDLLDMLINLLCELVAVLHLVLKSMMSSAAVGKIKVTMSPAKFDQSMEQGIKARERWLKEHPLQRENL